MPLWKLTVDFVISDRADTTLLAILCWNNQQKKPSENSFDSVFLSCLPESIFREALNKTDVCGAKL